MFEKDHDIFVTMVTYRRVPLLIENIDLLRKAFYLSKQRYDYTIRAIIVPPDHLHMLIYPEKIEDYPNAPSGFPGLETTLPILITEFNERKIPIERLVELTSSKPAEIFEMRNRGKIKKGYFADLAVIDTEKGSPIVAALFQTKAKYSPFDGRMVKALVDTVFVNGKMYEN